MYGDVSISRHQQAAVRLARERRDGTLDLRRINYRHDDRLDSEPGCRVLGNLKSVGIVGRVRTHDDGEPRQTGCKLFEQSHIVVDRWALQIGEARDVAARPPA